METRSMRQVSTSTTCHQKRYVLPRISSGHVCFNDSPTVVESGACGLDKLFSAGNWKFSNTSPDGCSRRHMKWSWIPDECSYRRRFLYPPFRQLFLQTSIFAPDSQADVLTYFAWETVFLRAPNFLSTFETVLECISSVVTGYPLSLISSDNFFSLFFHPFYDPPHIVH